MRGKVDLEVFTSIDNILFYCMMTIILLECYTNLRSNIYLNPLFSILVAFVKLLFNKEYVCMYLFSASSVSRLNVAQPRLLGAYFQELLAFVLYIHRLCTNKITRADCS